LWPISCMLRAATTSIIANRQPFCKLWHRNNPYQRKTSRSWLQKWWKHPFLSSFHQFEALIPLWSTLFRRLQKQFCVQNILHNCSALHNSMPNHPPAQKSSSAAAPIEVWSKLPLPKATFSCNPLVTRPNKAIQPTIHRKIWSEMRRSSTSSSNNRSQKDYSTPF
jgi:hypothetical protein